jgi:hypothetical protein
MIFRIDRADCTNLGIQKKGVVQIREGVVHYVTNFSKYDDRADAFGLVIKINTDRTTSLSTPQDWPCLSYGSICIKGFLESIAIAYEFSECRGRGSFRLVRGSFVSNFNTDRIRNLSTPHDWPCFH